MSSRRVDIYFIRFVEFANACGFFYLGWAINVNDIAGLRSRSEIDITDSVLLLAVMTFSVAFIASFREDLTGSHRPLIRATHQAFAIVTIAIATISLVGLPDTAPVTISMTVFGLLQVAALKASKQFVRDASKVNQWPIKIVRVALVFVFAFLFLLMK